MGHRGARGVFVGGRKVVGVGVGQRQLRDSGRNGLWQSTEPLTGLLRFVEAADAEESGIVFSTVVERPTFGDRDSVGMLGAQDGGSGFVDSPIDDNASLSWLDDGSSDAALRTVRPRADRTHTCRLTRPRPSLRERAQIDDVTAQIDGCARADRARSTEFQPISADVRGDGADVRAAAGVGVRPITAAIGTVIAARSHRTAHQTAIAPRT